MFLFVGSSLHHFSRRALPTVCFCSLLKVGFANFSFLSFMASSMDGTSSRTQLEDASPDGEDSAELREEVPFPVDPASDLTCIQGRIDGQEFPLVLGPGRTPLFCFCFCFLFFLGIRGRGHHGEHLTARDIAMRWPELDQVDVVVKW